VNHEAKSEALGLELQKEIEGEVKDLCVLLEEIYLRRADCLEISYDSQGGCVTGKY
jgi:hypothetical protein